MELLQLTTDAFNFHCPFNPSHTMPQKTFIKHLIKCPDRKPDFVSCSFNLSHVMHKSKVKTHEENCPNRQLFDVAIYEPEDFVRPVPIIENVPTMVYDESWEGLEQTTDVLNDINKKTILMKAKHGNTKSERKTHRMTLHQYDVMCKSGQIQEEPKRPLFIGDRPDMSKK